MHVNFHVYLLRCVVRNGLATLDGYASFLPKNRSLAISFSVNCNKKGLEGKNNTFVDTYT